MATVIHFLAHTTNEMQAATHQGLQQVVIEMPYSTSDTTCLSETFRLVTVAVKGPGSNAWLAALLDGSRDLLQHVIWICDNTLNSLLYER